MKNKLVFGKNKSSTNHIATLRIIIEQSTEWQSPLYINFIDFEKVFDSIDRRYLDAGASLWNTRLKWHPVDIH